MSQSSLLLLSLLVGACASPGRSPAQEVEWFQRGLYVGGSAGVATSTADRGRLEADVDDIWPGSEVTNFDDEDFAWKTYLGYRFDRPFAIEGGWVELGEITSDITTTDPDTQSFLDQVESVHPKFGAGPFLGARYYVIDNDRFHIGVGGGVWWWNAQVTVRSSGEKMDPKRDKLDGYFGVNAIWDFTDRLSIRAEYERYYLDEFEADVFMAGLQYRIL